MGYRDDKDALVAECDALRRELARSEATQAELEAARTKLEEKVRLLERFGAAPKTETAPPRSRITPLMLAIGVSGIVVAIALAVSRPLPQYTDPIEPVSSPRVSPTPPTKWGKLRLDSEPQGAAITFGEVLFHKVTPAVVVGSAGTRVHVGFSLEGYEPLEMVTTFNDSEQTYTAKLTKIPSPSKPPSPKHHRAQPTEPPLSVTH